MKKNLLMYFETAKDLLIFLNGKRPSHVLFPGVRSGLPSTSSCLLSTKCSSDFWKKKVRQRRGLNICVDIKTCSWGGNIHIHNATVRTLGAQPLQMRNNCWKFWNIFIHMSTWKTLPMSLVKMDELSPCSTSLFHRMPSSKLEHFKMYTIGANVSLGE